MGDFVCVCVAFNVISFWPLKLENCEAGLARLGPWAGGVWYLSLRTIMFQSSMITLK